MRQGLLLKKAMRLIARIPRRRWPICLDSSSVVLSNCKCRFRCICRHGASRQRISGQYFHEWQSPIYRVEGLSYRIDYSGEDGSGKGIFFQRYDASDNKVVSEFWINIHTSGDRFWGDITSLSNGDFIVTWNSSSQNASVKGAYIQR